MVSALCAPHLHRTFGVTLKTAWWMSHRIREAMTADDIRDFVWGGKCSAQP
jgi:hypothetical protein